MVNLWIWSFPSLLICFLITSDTYMGFNPKKLNIVKIFIRSSNFINMLLMMKFISRFLMDCNLSRLLRLSVIIKTTLVWIFSGWFLINYKAFQIAINSALYSEISAARPIQMSISEYVSYIPQPTLSFVLEASVIYLLETLVSTNNYVIKNIQIFWSWVICDMYVYSPFITLKSTVNSIAN